MSEAQQRAGWAFDDYLAWEREQAIKHELVDGQVHAMAGGTNDHDTICNNLRGELRTQLRGKPCRVQGPDLKVRSANNARYPDAFIDCGLRSGNEVLAREPVAVFEVLSASTAWIDQGLKLRDYEAIASIRTYALISQDELRALVYWRNAGSLFSIGSATLLEGRDARIDIAEFGVTLRFGDLYEGSDAWATSSPGV